MDKIPAPGYTEISQLSSSWEISIETTHLELKDIISSLFALPTVI